MTIQAPDRAGVKTSSHPPGQGIHSEGRRFFEASAEQNLLLGSIEVGDRNGLGAEVRPVQVLVDPVHGDAHRRLNVRHLLVGAGVSFIQNGAGSENGRTSTLFL